MPRALSLMLIVVCIFLAAPTNARAQQESSDDRTVLQIKVELDDDWGWGELWDWLVWDDLEKSIQSGILRNDVDVSQAEDTSLDYRLSSAKENAMDAAVENLINVLLGSMIPGAGIIGDILSDIRFSFDIFRIPGF